MKAKLFKILYKLFSFLADKTNGCKIFVNPKLFFGMLIVGSITTVSTNSCVTCYDPTPTCYDPIVTCYDMGDTIPQNDTIPDILCYASPLPH